MLPPFSSQRAHSKKDALFFLASEPGAAVIAGGTDLIVRMEKGEIYRRVIDIGAVPELATITEEEKLVRLGATVTHGRIACHPAIARRVGGLASACSAVGSPQIRNMGTLGGNLVNASPAADSIAPLLVHDAVLTLESVSGERAERLERFITGPYKTTIGGNELLTGVTVEALDGYEEGYRRVARRAAWAISRLSVAWAFREEEGRFADVRIAVGSCTPAPLRAREAEGFLAGKRREGPAVAEAVRIVLDRIRRASGTRASFVYKLPVVRDLLVAALGGPSCS